MKKTLILFSSLIVIILLNNANTIAQNIHLEPCAAHNVYQKQAEENDQYAQAVQKTFEKAKTLAKQKLVQKTAGELDTNPIFKIPVVVHVVYENEDENLPDGFIHSQIDILNKHFRHLNENASDLRPIFEDIVGDPMIEFYLADTDPDGNPTDGITRTETDVESFGPNLDAFEEALVEAFEACGIEGFDAENFDIEDFDPTEFIDELPCLIAELENIEVEEDPLALDYVKAAATGGKAPWDTEKYLNLWVCDLGGALLGFAYPPVEAPNFPEETIPANIEEVDGVVIHYQVFDANNPYGVDEYESIADQGISAVHEIGHYLGLRHTWGDPMIEDDPCTADDGIDDTPIAATNSQPTDPNNLPPCEELFDKDSCQDDELPDMIENYMDYSLETCQNSFTNEQIGLMRSMLEIARTGLLSKIEVDFVADNTSIFSGESVNFSLTQNSNAFEVEWDFGDGNTSNAANPEHTFIDSGIYTISLTGTNPSGENTTIKTEYIEVLDIVGVETLSPNAWDIHPNPSNGLFVVEQIEDCDQCLITIYDAKGQTIKTLQNNLNNQVTIDLTAESKGIYFVTINQNGKMGSKKILVK